MSRDIDDVVIHILRAQAHLLEVLDTAQKAKQHDPATSEATESVVSAIVDAIQSAELARIRWTMMRYPHVHQ